jgi:hypothetical protein
LERMKVENVAPNTIVLTSAIDSLAREGGGVHTGIYYTILYYTILCCSVGVTVCDDFVVIMTVVIILLLYFLFVAAKNCRFYDLLLLYVITILVTLV